MEEQVAKKPESRKKRTLTVCAVLMGLVLAVYLLLFQVNRFSLEMQLLGDAHTVLEYGSVYEESGVQLSLKGSVFFREGMLPEDAVLETVGSVDTDKLGTYVLTYRGVYRGLEVTAQRTVAVVDTQAPVISLVSFPLVSAVIGQLLIFTSELKKFRINLRIHSLQRNRSAGTV